MTTISLAASGKAMIAPYVTESSSTGTVCKSYIYLSNITDAPLSIKMTLYKTDGSVLLDTGNSISSGEIAGDSLGDYSENVTNGSVSFSLAAHSSGRVRITSSDYRIGYGIIEWTQDSQVAYGLMQRANPMLVFLVELDFVGILILTTGYHFKGSIIKQHNYLREDLYSSLFYLVEKTS